MSKKGKKSVLEGCSRRRPPRKRNTTESVAVAVPGKLTKDSPLAGYQWQPGESGNPAGRPRTSDLKAAVREFADEEDPKLRKTRLRQWLEMADRRARQGSPKHLELLLAYAWGRPVTPLEHGGTIDLREELRKARERVKAPDVLVPIAPANGHEVPTDANGAIRLAQAAAEAAGQDSAREDPEQPAKPKIRVEPWAN